MAKFSKKAIDYTGKTVAGWLAIRRDEDHDLIAKSAHWRIRCVLCGHEKITQQTYLKTGSVGRCNCVRAGSDGLRKKKIQRMENRIKVLESKKSQLQLQLDTLQNGDNP